MQDFSRLGKIGANARWQKIHAQVTLNKRITKERIAINAYLCGDGNIGVSKNGRTHYLRFFLDDKNLAERVKLLFEREFNLFPKIRIMESKIPNGSGYFKVEICSKPAYNELIKMSTYGHMMWSIPKDLTSSFRREWIRCFFDCEAYVNVGKKQIQVKSVNGQGLKDLKTLLEKDNIFPKLYGPYNQRSPHHHPYFFLIVLGNLNIFNFKRKIGFYHSRKIEALNRLGK